MSACRDDGGGISVALAPLILLAPACVMFFVFVLYPIAQSLVLSLYEWTAIGPKKWVGLRQFCRPRARSCRAHRARQ